MNALSFLQSYIIKDTWKILVKENNQLDEKLVITFFSRIIKKEKQENGIS